MEHNYLKEIERVDHLGNTPVKFGKNPVHQFLRTFLKEKFTDTRSDARTMDTMP